MHLSDLLSEEIRDYEGERLRLDALFQKEKLFYNRYESTTLKESVSHDFMDSKLRGTSISIEDFLCRCSREWRIPSLDGLLFCCEVMLNLTALISEKHWCSEVVLRGKSRLEENIRIILDKTGHYSKKESDGLIYVIKKDALASAVIEDLSDKDVAMAVLAYNRIESKGDLEAKRKLLFTIGKHVEPILQQYKTFNDLKFQVADNVRFGLNNLHVRHNNEKGKVAKPILAKISKEALEEAYDDLYRSMLLLIELDKYPETDKRIKALRAKV